MTTHATRNFGRLVSLLVLAVALLIGSTAVAGAASPLPGADQGRTPASLAADDDNPSPQNRVWLVNRANARMTMRGKAQVNGIEGDTVTPGNLAYAESSCFDCSTFAVALQLNLYEAGASHIAPANRAAAVNYSCTRCTTVARAVQYTIPVEDPETVAEGLRDDIEALNAELKAIAASASPTEAEAQIEAVISDFRALVNSIPQGGGQDEDEVDEEHD